MCEYLREHHAEYRNTKQKMKELMEQYPKVRAVFETDDHKILTFEDFQYIATRREWNTYRKQLPLKKYFQLFSQKFGIWRVWDA